MPLAGGVGPLAKYLGGDDRIALGQMLNEIPFSDARTAAGLRFRQWLRDESLLPRLQEIDLHRLYKLHIPGKHTNESHTSSWRMQSEISGDCGTATAAARSAPAAHWGRDRGP